ncbi:MAG TPA: HGGxSTG domain-containing protein, partial [Gemmatimonadaceae bacterium]
MGERDGAAPAGQSVVRQRSQRVRASTCAAKTRSGTPCRNAAGFKTDHVGQGRCRFHGGCNPVKSGRYSKINRTRIRDLIEAHAADDAPLDTLPELAAARALFQDFLERYDENHDAVLAWYAQQRINPEQQEALYAALNELEELQTSCGAEFTDVQSKRLSDARSAVAL